MSSFINRNYPIRKPGGSKPCTLFEVAGLILGITELSDCEPCSPSCKSTALDITTVRHTTQGTKCHGIGDWYMFGLGKAITKKYYKSRRTPKTGN